MSDNGIEWLERLRGPLTKNEKRGLVALALVFVAIVAFAIVRAYFL